jgi:hypothetical protein
MLKSFIVRIYRHDKKKPRSIVGVVEEVGVERKRAFTNLDELWEILRSIKKDPKKSKKSQIHFHSKYDIEKRNELRTRKEMPFVLIFHKKNLDSSSVNYSKHGIGLKIYKRVALPVGDVVNLRAGHAKVKAQVKWLDNRSDPSFTMAGLKVLDGELNLKGLKRAEA